MLTQTAASWTRKAELWIDGFNPTREGWTQVGPADEGEVIEAAMHLKDLGHEVETFIAPLGKLTYFTRVPREEPAGGE